MEAESSGRSLLAVEQTKVKWTQEPKYIAGLVLSVLVSLTSSIDRECGSSLYLAIFAVLLNLPLRNAIAMTAFTVALGSFGPGIASMSEAHVTERGVLALVDYPGALLLLPTMYFGISWGVVVNMWFPNWLLALLLVVFMALSNLQLLYSFIKLRKLRKESKAVVQELHSLIDLQRQRQLSLANGQGHQAAPAATGKQASAGEMAVNMDGKCSTSELASSAAQLKLQVEHLVQEAQHIEGMALLYPAYHVASVEEAIRLYDFTDEELVVGKEQLGLAGKHQQQQQHYCHEKQHPSSTKGQALAEGAAAADAVPISAALSTTGMSHRQADPGLQELLEYRSASSRYTLRWKKWWKLNVHFELALVLKIVVLHLLTEGIRHHTTKPCSHRFWIMLGGVTGLVTCFLIFISVCYNRRRLWRGAHWVDALREVKQIQQQQASSLSNEHCEEGTITSNSHTPNQAPAAAVAAGEAVAVAIDGQQGAGSEVAGSGSGEEQQGKQKSRRCCSNFGKRAPWKWATAPDAITNVHQCNSRNCYKTYTRPRMLAAAAVTQVIGVMGCALGLPSGPAMAYLLLWLGLKPHIVAGTSRFLVMCFCFGSFVAYLIAGNLQRNMAAAYGLLNLGLAPLGLLLFKKLKIRSTIVLLVSLAMGLLGVVSLVVWQLVPLLAHLAGTSDRLPKDVQANHAMLPALTKAGNQFDLQRFCLGKHYYHQ
eukprot:gene5189-5427_t